MESHMTLDSWVITAVSGGGLTILGFLLKYAFTQIQSGINELNAALKKLSEEIGTVKSDVKVMEAEVKHLLFRVEQLEKEKK